MSERLADIVARFRHWCLSQSIDPATVRLELHTRDKGDAEALHLQIKLEMQPVTPMTRSEWQGFDTKQYRMAGVAVEIKYPLNVMRPVPLHDAADERSGE